ncbi:hypothetical protein F4827_000162 [Paraburkholderia bannensis]|uniref:Uncharacterized protein n=1 Tax=Paraburkholderia bannensis TaxID=765414 RepID=A0A7W9TRV6_9BURK|nr:MULTISPECIES: hypothetical protein [Paraburkholderia]MBB3255631.1 hypothetical protein [Paraburkholderia sp. WP4_3_2]MBB6100358.1 hypothetical protein [Paraburkholderia bannensis]
MRLIRTNAKLSHAVSHVTAVAAVLIPAALLAVAPSVYAQTATDAASASFVVASVNADVVPATTAVSATVAPVTAAVSANDAGMQAATLDTSASASQDNGTAGSNLSAAPLAADPGPAGDEPVMAGVGSIDDQTLSHQRGGAVGMLMVAATPQLMRGGNSVTLWDEIAPPAPLPIPVDSGQAAQGNIASYTRK